MPVMPVMSMVARSFEHGMLDLEIFVWLKKQAAANIARGVPQWLSPASACSHRWLASFFHVPSSEVLSTGCEFAATYCLDSQILFMSTERKKHMS